MAVVVVVLQRDILMARVGAPASGRLAPACPKATSDRRTRPPHHPAARLFPAGTLSNHTQGGCQPLLTCVRCSVAVSPSACCCPQFAGECADSACEWSVQPSHTFSPPAAWLLFTMIVHVRWDKARCVSATEEAGWVSCVGLETYLGLGLGLAEWLHTLV